MLTYITAFIFYTLAMIGVMLMGFVIYKKTIMPKRLENKGMIKILEKVDISPKKSLLVVKVKNERFLIASDAERTTCLSKLNDEKQAVNIPSDYQQPAPQYNGESQQQRLDRIEKQFKQLYSDTQEEEKPQKTPDRKEMIRKLLKDLNDTTGARRTGSY